MLTTAGDLDAALVVKDVDTPERIGLLLGRNGHFVQGKALGPPIAAAEMTAFVSTFNQTKAKSS